MNEVERVLERLERIDELRRTGAGSRLILEELRGLIGDGAAWAAAEGVGAERARTALAELDEALNDPGGRQGEREAAGDERSERRCATASPSPSNGVV